MKMMLEFENGIDLKKGNNIYNKYYNLLSDKTTLAISETGLNIKLEDLNNGSTPVLNAITKQLNSMTANVIDVVEVVNNYTDISQPFPVKFSNILKEYDRTKNTAFLCSAICKKLASNAMKCGSNYSDTLSDISKYGNILIRELKTTTISTPIYDPEIMMVVSAINVLVDIMFTFIPAHKMIGVARILRFWRHIPMCVHRIPEYSYQHIIRIDDNLPKHIKMIVDEECTMYPKTRFIFNYTEYRELCDQFNDIFAFFQSKGVISTYRDPMLTKFLIQKLDDISTTGNFAEFCDEYKKEIIEQCGSLLKEPV